MESLRGQVIFFKVTHQQMAQSGIELTSVSTRAQVSPLYQLFLSKLIWQIYKIYTKTDEIDTKLHWI